APLMHGDSIELGPVTLVLQRASKAETMDRPRRLWTHAYFEGRLEEECARAELSGVPFAVLRVQLEGAAAPGVVQKVLADSLAPTDIIASYGPGEYEAIAFGSKPAAMGKKLKDSLDQAGAPVRVGHAVYGPDGKDPDRLFAEACARLEQMPG